MVNHQDRSARPSDVGSSGESDLAATGIDFWAQENPWRPRVSPWFLYMLVLAITQQASSWQSWTYAPLKMIQAVSVGYLIWRWRRLVPEISLRFHWSVVPVSIFLTVGWIYLHGWTISIFPSLADSKPGFFQTLYGENLTLFWLAASAHLLAMCTVVPLIEETLNRSLLLRSLHDWRATGTGVLQFLCDLPWIGDWLSGTRLGASARQQSPAFETQFHQVPLGSLSWFGVAGSTMVFMLVHASSDWPGAMLCGVTWCLMLNLTRYLGLGAVIWSHGIVNLLLWIYVLATESWQFL